MSYMEKKLKLKTENSSIKKCQKMRLKCRFLFIAKSIANKIY